MCSKGVCHLDIKPDNMLLSSSVTPAAAVGARWFPTVKLADFGTWAGAYMADVGGGELASCRVCTIGRPAIPVLLLWELNLKLDMRLSLPLCVYGCDVLGLPGMAAHAPVRRTVGTLFYVAPEILTEGYADQASDMWRCVAVFRVPPLLLVWHSCVLNDTHGL